MGEWPLVRLGECLRQPPDYGANAAAVPLERGLPRYVRITDVADDGTLLQEGAVGLRRESADGALLEEGDLVFARSGATVGKTYLYTPADGECAFAGYLIRFRTDPAKLLPEFLSRYARSRAYWRWVARTAHAGAQPNISAQEYMDLPVPGPASREQEAIVETLKAWECAQRKLAALIEAKRGLKRGFAQQLLTGKRRFKEFTSGSETRSTSFGPIPSSWDYARMDQIALEVRERAGSGFARLPVVSCSKHRGLVDSEEYFGKRVYGSDRANYKVVRAGQFAYPSNHLEEGSIGLLSHREVAVVSPIYTVFQPSDRVVPEFLYAVFKTDHCRELFAARTNASVNRRGSARWKQFGTLRVPLPPRPEQEQIAALLGKLGNEITLLERLRDLVELQRRGVSELLLMGKVRVPA